jgi:exonuclease III
LRLNSDPEHIEKIEKLFLYNKQRSYVFVHNSTKNSRGVGILLASDLNANIMSSKKDDDENILFLTISIGEHILTVTAVYGPNRDTRAFFNNLSSYLRMTSHLPSVIGGDWNTTVSTEPVDHNIDIFRMVAPPSLTRSFWLNEICEELRLCDPFRAIHPTKRDFTFDSRGARKNRSRIDFFLISENLPSTVAKCYISLSVGCALFDHKSVHLDFRTEKIYNKMFINRSIISHPRTEDVVAAAVADTYLAHARVDKQIYGRVLPQQLVFREDEPNPLDAQKVIVGNLIRAIAQANDISLEIETNGNSALLELHLAGKLTTIRELHESVWDDNAFSNLDLTCEGDVFLEVLLSNVKGAVISFQSWVRKKDNLRKNLLIKKIQSLKNDFVINYNEIHENEILLSDIVNKEVLEKVKSMKIFDCLNSEKPTPMFLNLAQVSKSDKKLSSVCKPDGSPFTNNMDRNEFIVSYYENLYKKSASEPPDLRGCVEEFLGNDIVNSHIVQNSKLSEAERYNLDLPLTIEELERSMDGANMKSAPGVDGLSNVFLKNFGITSDTHYFDTALRVSRRGA